jgi:MFS family permease
VTAAIESTEDGSLAAPAAPTGMFASLRVRNYRLFISGQIVSNIGTWMQRIAQDWLVFVLTGNDPVALGIAFALQFTPTLFLSLWAGVLADRLDKRRLLMVVLSGIAGCALVLGLLDVTGVVRLWHVYVLCFVLGCFTAFESPIRQSFVAEMVGQAQVPNAVALNSSTFNLARIVGPAVSGFLITWVGTGPSFLINAASTACVVTALGMMDSRQLHRSPAVPRRRGQLVEGLRYVRHHREILAIMVMVFFVSTFGITFFTSLAIIAVQVFHKQADGYGLLSTMLAIGTLSGALWAARRSARGGPKAMLLFGSAVLFGLLEITAGLMPTYLSFGLALVPVGVATVTFMTAANSTVQLAVSPEMRGRVMGLYMLVFLGGNPIGGPLTGWLAKEFGPRSPLIIGGVVAVCAALGCAIVVLRRSRRPEAEPLQAGLG